MAVSVYWQEERGDRSERLLGASLIVDRKLVHTTTCLVDLCTGTSIQGPPIHLNSG